MLGTFSNFAAKQVPSTNCLLQACDVFDVKMIQIWTFPAAPTPSTKRVPSLAERVAYLRYSINLRLFNWPVPGLVLRHKGPIKVTEGPARM